MRRPEAAQFVLRPERAHQSCFCVLGTAQYPVADLVRNGTTEQGRRVGLRLHGNRADRKQINGHQHAGALFAAHIGLGDRDAAFDRLARAAGDRDPSLVNVAVEPRFEPLRRDPRYADLLDALGLAFRA